MTPKEKAKELLYNYELQVRFSMEDCSFTYRDSNYGLAIKRTAKQCALIAIDEMLDFRNGLYINEGSLAHQWLLDVKHEIQKL
jgi:hypothetical protein